MRNTDQRDFPGGPVVQNPHCNARDAGSIPGWGTKVAPGMAKNKKVLGHLNSNPGSVAYYLSRKASFSIPVCLFYLFLKKYQLIDLTIVVRIQ